MRFLWLLVVPVFAFISSCGSDFDNELIYAAGQGDAKAVTALIKNEANLNYSSLDDGLTPLIAAAQHGHLDVVKLLVAEGADPSLKDGGGSPLFWAAFFAHKDVFNYLLSEDARLSATTQNIQQLKVELEKAKEAELLAMVLDRYEAENK